MTDYDCYCEPAEGERGSFESTEIRRSKKARHCCECRDTIQVGERYERLVCYLDGFQVFVTCLFCAEEYNRLTSDDYPIAKGDLACALIYELREGRDDL